MDTIKKHLASTATATEVDESSLTVKLDDSYLLEVNFRSVKTSPLSVLIADWQAIYDRDPTARNWLEVMFYPGLQALCWHRVAHWLHGIGIPVVPRVLSYLSRFLTGIEIHPGAKIGKGVFIDHGMGVVIGETAVVGDYVLIYQGVTLGGTGKEMGKRHPTLGNHVIVGAGALLLGNIELGDRVRIGAGSVVLRHVPSDSTVVGVPGRVTKTSKAKESANLLGNESLPDPEAAVIRSLFERIKSLEQQVEALQTQLPLNNIHESQKYLEGATTNSNEMIEEFLHGAGI
ncbi:serine O-acetyltransferase [Tumidithrix helvetica PCC 7403]|uniref:serine O-acetyltransferase n=1 Tax=Tumidithrix helvetica TaxID=3457545 RepID=UPI003CA70B20